MEHVSQTQVTLEINDTVAEDVRIPPGFTRWTLLILLQNVSASPDPVVMDIEYQVGNKGFHTRNPPGTGTTLELNKANVVTSEDAVPKVKLQFTAGATLPDGDLTVVLLGAR